MRKSLIGAGLLAAFLVAGCGFKSCPPASFYPAMAGPDEMTGYTEKRTAMVKIPTGWSRTQLWNTVLDAYADRKYQSELVDLQRGLIRTDWKYFTHGDDSGFGSGYRVRLVIKFLGKPWKEVKVEAQAAWRPKMEDPKTQEDGHDLATTERFARVLTKLFAGHPRAIYSGN